jgi:hypothetical protein
MDKMNLIRSSSGPFIVFKREELKEVGENFIMRKLENWCIHIF